MKNMTGEKKQKIIKIAGLGEVLWDLYDHEKFVGGSPANFAAHIAQAGHESYLCSRVGEDDNGRELVEKLNEMNINTSGVQFDIFKATGTVKITVDKTKSPIYACSSNVAFDDMRFDSIWEEIAPQMDAVFFSLLAQRSEGSREAMFTFLGKQGNRNVWRRTRNKQGSTPSP